MRLVRGALYCSEKPVLHFYRTAQGSLGSLLSRRRRRDVRYIPDHGTPSSAGKKYRNAARKSSRVRILSMASATCLAEIIPWS